MKCAGLQPDVISCNALIRAYTHGNQFSKGMALFNEMSASGIKPDEITYSTIFHLCEKTGNGTHSVQLLHKMLDDLGAPKSVGCIQTYCTLIRAWTKAGLHAEAVSL